MDPLTPQISSINFNETFVDDDDDDDDDGGGGGDGGDGDDDDDDDYALKILCWRAFSSQRIPVCERNDECQKNATSGDGWMIERKNI